MNEENYKISIKRLEESISKDFITKKLKEQVRNSGMRMSQIIINKENDNSNFYLTSVIYFYSVIDGKLNKYKKSDVKSVMFVKPSPHGAAIIEMNNTKKIYLKNIIAGRVFDFIQDVKPRVISLAGYDNTIRGEYPQLLDPDHAEENDKLRRWMQDGHISHYQYDDANPSYPKAGK